MLGLTQALHTFPTSQAQLESPLYRCGYGLRSRKELLYRYLCWLPATCPPAQPLTNAHHADISPYDLAALQHDLLELQRVEE